MTSRFLTASVLALMAAMVVTLTAFGHAELEESDPVGGATISTPYTLTATFSEEFDPDRSFIRIVSSDGTRVAEGGASPDDLVVMTVDLPELEPGEYEARWQTVTPDDNGVERGTFTFIVEAAATPSPTPQPTATATATDQPSADPTASAEPTTTTSPSPAASPTPSATPAPIDGAPSAGSNDLILALVLAGVAIAAVVAFVFVRGRR